MNTTIITRLLRMLTVLAVQLLVLSHLHLLGYATPLILAYVTMHARCSSGRVSLLLWGAATGLVFDTFSDTGGTATAACTLLAMVQPALLTLYAPRDAAEDMAPTAREMGRGKYSLYVLTTMLLFHTAFYALDAFSLHDWRLTLASMALGTAAATALVLAADLLVISRRADRAQ